MSDAAFESYLAHWREADPQRATAWLFLKPDERIRYGALAALQEEWLKAVRGAREPQVAAAKLGWWREEMQRAAEGEARHPLTQALFEDARVREVPAASWSAAVDAAAVALTAAPAADLPSELAAMQPWAAAFAEIETRVWFGARAESARAAAVIALSQSIAGLRALGGNGGAVLPMNLLARHGLTVDALAADSPSRREAVRDAVVSLQRGLESAVTMAGPLTLFRAVHLQHDRHTLARAARADAPLAALRAPGHGFRNLLKTWQAARIWRHESNT